MTDVKKGKEELLIVVWFLTCLQQLQELKKRNEELLIVVLISDLSPATLRIKEEEWGVADCCLICLQQLQELKKRNEELEKERLANVPIDTAKEIKNLQNKIVSSL